MGKTTATSKSRAKTTDNKNETEKNNDKNNELKNEMKNESGAKDDGKNEAKKETTVKKKSKNGKVLRPYNRFMQTELPKVKAENPAMDHKTAFKTVAERWKTSPENPKNQNQDDQVQNESQDQ